MSVAATISFYPPAMLHIGLVGHGLKMERIYTGTVFTGVVNF